MKGAHKRMGIHGISDITTDEFHAEIKEWKNWRGSISQLLLYNMAAPRGELRIYFFGERPIGTYTDDDTKTIVDILKTFGISSFHVLISSKDLQIINLETSEVSNHVVERKCEEPTQLLSDVEKTEIDALIGSLQKDPVVNIEFLSKLLNTTKTGLCNTLYRTYIKGVDYVSRKMPNPSKKAGCHGSNNYTLVLISPDCFERMCILSRTKKAEMVRSYMKYTTNKDQ